MVVEEVRTLLILNKMAFTEKNDPIHDMGIGKIRAKMVGEKHIYVMSVRTWKLLKEYFRESIKWGNENDSLFEDLTNHKITQERYYEAVKENPLYERREKIYREILRAGGNKHWVRNNWRIVR